METINSKYFCGLKISIFSTTELIDYIDHTAINHSLQPKILYGYSLGLFSSMKNQPNLCNIINQFDVVGTDGMGFRTICKLFHYPVHELISIPNMVLITLDRLNSFKKRDKVVYLLGSTQESNDNALLELKKTYKNITFYGTNGYYPAIEENRIIDDINTKRPNLLLIGLPTPAKENFVDNYKEKLIVDMIIPCGGMINVFAGKEKLTPSFLKKIGLAWFVRFIQHPRNRLEVSSLSFKILYKLVLTFIENKFNKKLINIPEVINQYFSNGYRN